MKVNCSDDVLDISHTCANKHTKETWAFNQLGNMHGTSMHITYTSDSDVSF